MYHSFLNYPPGVTHVSKGGCFSIMNMAATNILVYVAFPIISYIQINSEVDHASKSRNSFVSPETLLSKIIIKRIEPISSVPTIISFIPPASALGIITFFFLLPK